MRSELPYRTWSSRTKPAVLGVLSAWFILIAAVLVINCCSGCVSAVHVMAQTSRAPRTIAEQLHYAVQIDSLCISGDPFAMLPHDAAPHISAGNGSGTLLDGRRVLTAAHVIHCEYLSDVHVTTSAGQRIKARIVKVWYGHDTAELELDDTIADVVPPLLALPRLGSGACTSYAWPLPPGGSCGTVAELPALFCPTTAEGHHWCEDVTLSLIVNQGNSGGGVYDDRGDLIGVVTAGIFDNATHLASGTGFAASVWPIRGEI